MLAAVTLKLSGCSVDTAATLAPNAARAAASCQRPAATVCALTSASSSTRPCWCSGPTTLSSSSNGNLEKSPCMVSSRHRHKQGPRADGHEFAESNLEVLPLVRLQQEVEGAHRVVAGPALADLRVGGGIELAITGLAKAIVGERQHRR